jgi:GAF domain-containing protein
VATLAGRPRGLVGPELARPADVHLTPDDALVRYLEHRPPVPLAVEELDVSVRHSVERHGVRLLVPLVTQGRLVGLLSIGDPAAEHGYSAEDLVFLTALARTAAPAARIAHLVARERARARREAEPG